VEGKRGEVATGSFTVKKGKLITAERTIAALTHGAVNV